MGGPTGKVAPNLIGNNHYMFCFFSEGRWVTQPAVARKCVKSSLFVHRVAEMSFGIARNIKGTNE